MRTDRRLQVVLASLILTLILTLLPTVTNAQPRKYCRPDNIAPPMNRYYVSLADEYNVPRRDVYQMYDAGVADEDMPTILYIYTHSQYSLRQIYSLRLRGATWENLQNWCGVPLYMDRGGPPYGNAYGYYRHGPGKYKHAPRQWDSRNDGYRGNGWEGEHEPDQYYEERGEED